MIKGYKIDKQIIKILKELKEKFLVNDEEFTKMIGIGNSTYYRLIKHKKASARTIRKLKDFLKENGYEVE